MCINFFTTTLGVILLSIVCLVDCSSLPIITERMHHPILAKLIKMRCTRRFSPGVCVDDVAPVWTFVFLQQNCTERLGCPNNYRTNRFQSYRMCMKRCRPLVDMYLKMLEFEEKNAGSNATLYSEEEDANDSDDRNLREGDGKNITSSGYKKNITVNLRFAGKDVEEGKEEDEEEYKQGEQDTRFIVYKDTNVNEDIMLADIDYVPGEIRSAVDTLYS